MKNKKVVCIILLCAIILITILIIRHRTEIKVKYIMLFKEKKLTVEYNYFSPKDARHYWFDFSRFYDFYDNCIIETLHEPDSLKGDQKTLYCYKKKINIEDIKNQLQKYKVDYESVWNVYDNKEIYALKDDDIDNTHLAPIKGKEVYDFVQNILEAADSIENIEVESKLELYT